LSGFLLEIQDAYIYRVTNSVNFQSGKWRGCSIIYLCIFDRICADHSVRVENKNNKKPIHISFIPIKTWTTRRILRVSDLKKNIDSRFCFFSSSIKTTTCVNDHCFSGETIITGVYDVIYSYLNIHEPSTLIRYISSGGRNNKSRGGNVPGKSACNDIHIVVRIFIVLGVQVLYVCVCVLFPERNRSFTQQRARCINARYAQSDFWFSSRAVHDLSHFRPTRFVFTNSQRIYFNLHIFFPR